MKLKDKLHQVRSDTIKEISRIEKELETNRFVDVKVCHTKLQCLESFKRDIEEIIAICDERNRY